MLRQRACQSSFNESTALSRGFSPRLKLSIRWNLLIFCALVLLAAGCANAPPMSFSDNLPPGVAKGFVEFYTNGKANPSAMGYGGYVHIWSIHDDQETPDQKTAGALAKERVWRATGGGSWLNPSDDETARLCKTLEFEGRIEPYLCDFWKSEPYDRISLRVAQRPRLHKFLVTIGTGYARVSVEVKEGMTTPVRIKLSEGRRLRDGFFGLDGFLGEYLGGLEHAEFEMEVFRRNSTGGGRSERVEFTMELIVEPMKPATVGN